ncbi:MAG: hypothetical protein GY836_18120, partial [Herbaspirillum sp.]|uniref:hypothetical protein n=1 Tax=Herbaspirillum sp. TaxID=1890675 RepID=UPI0025870300
GELQEGETATITIGLTDVDTTSADYASFTDAVDAAVAAYSGAGTVAFDDGTGVLTYTGGAGGTTLTALVIDLDAVDDNLVEGPEDYTVSLSGAGSGTGASVTGSGSITTTITDNDTATWSLAGSAGVTETGPGTASYTVSLAGELQEGETATITIGLTDVDTTSADYASFTDAVDAAVAAYSGAGTVA